MFPVDIAEDFADEFEGEIEDVELMEGSVSHHGGLAGLQLASRMGASRGHLARRLISTVHRIELPLLSTGRTREATQSALLLLFSITTTQWRLSLLLTQRSLLSIG